MKKMGRPTKQEQPRNNRVGIKLTSDEYALLNLCADKLGLTKTDTIMYAVNKLATELPLLD